MCIFCEDEDHEHLRESFLIKVEIEDRGGNREIVVVSDEVGEPLLARTACR